ncbi:MAG: 3-dehydroquinate synthase [Oscillospiraceae bacterium]|nr:3-dehydroquinate synthase [Oscillospiraceae bacterium]
MNCIRVNTGTPYDVRIRRGILREAGNEIKKIFPHARLAIVTDSNVSPLYLRSLLDSLELAGYQNTPSFTMEAGENTKSLESAGLLYQLLSQSKISRDCCLIALGGGVIGDLTGFVASTYLRGIPFIQIPTTLLAQVDSSVGGKTAVNLPVGKNLVGTFWQPSLVLCDPDTLATLPEDVFADGVAEALKCGMIKDPVLFDLLADQEPQAHLEEIIARCICVKRDVVEKDEYDTGERMLLNFGHTMGHAVENWMQYQQRHGQCVATGMVMIARAQTAAGTLPAAVLDRLLAACQKYGLPTCCKAPLDELFKICRQDKKNTVRGIRAILLRSIGDSYIQNFPFEAFEAFIKGGAC